jgi:predicted Rossmann fold nucleotide-binding protein DprA/Smf involved in DNA uptake
MKTKIEEQEGKFFVCLEGEMDTAAAMEAEKILQPLYKTGGRDVVINCEGLEYIDVERPTPPELSDKEQAVYDTMNTGKKHADEIVTDSGLPARQVLPILTVLELKGHIVRLAGKYFEQRN